jgi:parvulin-like peptidyl-prolyl isomerase
MTESIKVPTWALPFVISALGAAIAYGSSTAMAQSTADEVERIEKIVAQTAERATENGTSTKLNAQAIRNISESLSQQQETAKASDEKLAQLITIMLEQRRN